MLSEKCYHLIGTSEFEKCKEKMMDIFLEDGKERFEDAHTRTVDLIKESPFRIYRGLKIARKDRNEYIENVKENKFIGDYSGIGNNWSLEESVSEGFAKEFLDSVTETGIVFYGKANAEDID